MGKTKMERRDFLKMALAGLPVMALDWENYPRKENTDRGDNPYDAVIIGAGLGGLSCAAAFARQGFKPLVLEQHRIPGGYATSFKRPGGFVFDASLHSTSVGERNGIVNLIPGFPEIKSVKFVPHRTLYRAIYPEHDIRVPHKDLPGYIKLLQQNFPDDNEGIAALFKAMQGFTEDLTRYQQAGGKVDMSRLAQEFPYLMKYINRTWGAMLDDYLKNPKLKAVVTGLWGYFGLPPSKLASVYYVMPTVGYIQEGGYYPIGTSQAISDALAEFITARGGEIKYRALVEHILVKDHAAYGVRTQDGSEYTAKVVVSNANAYDTFHKMLDEKEYLNKYLEKMATFTASASSFQVWLGLKKDLIGELGIEDTEIFYYTGYDPEADYEHMLSGDTRKQGYGMTLYDNLYKGYSPEGKNTINIMNLQGYARWENYEADYFQGKKEEYRKEKERLADELIQRAEETLMPGLTKAIEVKETATPLTNVRYTRNYRGAIYGWDQTLDNSMPRRVAPKTPIKNLYLAGAWTQPGGGYGACLPSGLMCFGQIMQDWKGKS
jgi:phytoene dehydrogenase-like protein